jgi:predicted transcriptional regulator
LAKLSTYISSAAAQYDDFQTALTSILTKAGVNSSNAQKIVNKIISQEQPEQEDTR